MAGSRTGTTRWLTVRGQALRRGRREGQDRCPFCGVFLDYDVSRKPNSAEPDHIVSYTAGGTDTLDNLQIICRRCNQSKGGKLGAAKSLKSRGKKLRKRYKIERQELPTSQAW